MIRSVASKVMWLGRATVFLVGLAVIVGLIFGILSRATAHTGSAGLFHLNHNNPVSALSTLTGTLTGAVLKVDNNGTGPALSLEANAGKAPLSVNSTAGKATNLNADKLDGKDSSAFLLAGGTLPTGTTLRGNFEIDADGDENASITPHSVASNAISFGFALASAPVAHTIDVNESPPSECPGTASAPAAAPGHLCIYEIYEQNERDPGTNFYPDTINTTPYGTGLYTQSQSTNEFFVSRGTWAVTAP